MSLKFSELFPPLVLDGVDPSWRDRLQTEAGAYSLALELSERVDQSFGAARTALRNRADVARRVGSYWHHRNQWDNSAAAIVRHRAEATKAVAFNRQAVADAQAAHTALTSRAKALQEEIAAKRAKADEEVQALARQAIAAQQAFDEAVLSDEVAEQEGAEARLREAQLARAKGQALRASHDKQLLALDDQHTETLAEAAEAVAMVKRAGTALADAVRFAALVELDAATADMVRAYLMAARALAGSHLPVPLAFDSVEAWFSCQSRACATSNIPTRSGPDPVTVLQGLHMHSLATGLTPPDLTPFLTAEIA